MNNITWLYGKKIENISELQIFEEKLHLRFPAEYKAILLEYNGATPSPQNFTVSGGEKVFNYLIKIADLQNMFDNICREYNSTQILVPFADDPAGNLICFDFTENKNQPNIAFFDLDKGECVKVADNFVELLKSLN